MSKTYKGWEILKMTEEGKFKEGDRIYNDITRYEFDGELWVDIDNSPSTVEISEFIGQEFEFLQPPITFIEAIQLYEQGRKIKCELGESNRIYDPTINHKDTKIGCPLQSVFNHTISTKEILEGRWYIKKIMHKSNS